LPNAGQLLFTQIKVCLYVYHTILYTATHMNCIHMCKYAFVLTYLHMSTYVNFQ